MTVYVVTYWDYDFEEPVVTAFNNKVAAESFREYAKEKYNGACLDTVPVYSNFSQGMQSVGV